MRTKHKASKLIDPAAPWIRNVQVAKLGDLAPHIGGRPTEIAAKWFSIWQTRKWFSEANRKKADPELWQNFVAYEEHEQATFQTEAFLALFNGNHKFFSDLAKAVKHFADTQGKAVDPVRHAWLTYCNRAEGIFVGPETTRNKDGTICVTLESRTEPGWLTINKAREIAEQVTGRRWDNAEVRRGLKQCGLLESTAKRRTIKTSRVETVPATKQPRARAVRYTPAMLGLPLSYPKRSFWTRSDLHNQLYQAQAAYRAQMRRVHPDKGGNAETFGEWRRLWRNVKNQFRRHGIRLT